MRTIQQWAAVQYDALILGGGMDQVTPPLSLKPGVVRDSLNWECSIYGGYTRIPGYERVDGRTAPSSASYSVLPASIMSVVSVGNTVDGATSGATGVVCGLGADYLVITKTTGTFTTGEDIEISAVVIGQVTDSSGYSASSLQNAQFTAVAADIYRADIQVVPGSGSIRGVMYLDGTKYGWRDNAGGTACELYRSTTSGWVKVDFGYELSFTAGTTEISDGESIANGLGATGTVARVILESGSWGAGTAAGRLILSATAGTWANGNNIQVSAVTRATAGSAATAITQLPGGRYVSRPGSFGGVRRLYGCDGVNRGFEFDGTTFAPIATGMAVDSPDRVAVHKNHLFFSFGPSLQHSGIGTPYAWTPLLGASELLASDTVTDLINLPGSQSGGALAIYCRNDIDILYGSSTADWNLTNFNNGVGALGYTAQSVVDVFALDDRGVMSLASSLNYGNFKSASLTANIQPFVAAHRGSACASMVNRDKSQYRVFFSDGYGLYVTIVNGKMVGSMPVLFPDPVLCTTQGEDDQGNDVAFFGSDNGYIYQIDVGTSFDGEPIFSYFTLTQNNVKSPRILKRYRKASIEVTGDYYCEFNFGYSLGYGSLQYMQPNSADYASAFSQPYWDEFTWDEFSWDGQTLAPSECEMAGTAENVAITITSNSALFNEFTLNSAILHFSMRRGLR